MCIISGEIESVCDTKIIAAKVNNDKQLTIYSNKVDTERPVAMILPYPNAVVRPVIIETKAEDNGIFGNIDGLWNPFARTFGGNDEEEYFEYDSEPLEVHRSGNYQYSIATSAAELSQLNNKVFNIKSDLQTLLDEYLNRGFGFIICIIDKNVDYSPFAYVASIYGDKFFIPTKHYHEHANKPNSSQEYSDDWDHVIYILGAKKGNASSNLRLSTVSDYSFSGYLDNYVANNLFKQEIIGKAVNKDLICQTC